MSTSNADLIRRFEDSYLAGDLDTVMTILDDDIVVREAPSVPYPGDHRGKEAFLGLAASFMAAWELPDGVELEILPAGEDRVLVLVDGRAIAKASGEPYRMRIAEVYTVRDGRIAEIEVFYWDTAEVARVTRTAAGSPVA